MTTVHDRDRWSTPKSVVDAVSNLLRSRPAIDLAASPHNAVADVYFTEKHGGLLSQAPYIVYNSMRNREICNWAWLNPPYSRGNMELFTEWAARYVESGGVVALCHRPDLSTKWYLENVLPYAKALLVPSKRIRFIPPDGVSESAPNFAALITIMSTKPIIVDHDYIIEGILWLSI